jgi:hypothetical protein
MQYGKELPESSEFCLNCKASVKNGDGSSETAAERILSEGALQQH